MSLTRNDIKYALEGTLFTPEIADDLFRCRIMATVSCLFDHFLDALYDTYDITFTKKSDRIQPHGQSEGNTIDGGNAG